MPNKFVSKYPSIIIDKNPNSVNERLQKKINIEEYYDLLHHTHDMSSMVAPEGQMTYQEMQETINELNQTVEEQNNVIQELKACTEELEKTIHTIKTELENVASVSDWDVETPGNQDAEGNDLGTLLGFDMTEIS